MADGGAGPGMTKLLGRADQALYEGKAAGRNTVVGLELAKVQPGLTPAA